MQLKALEFVKYLVDFAGFEIGRFRRLLDGFLALVRREHLFDSDFRETIAFALEVANKSPSTHDFWQRIENSYHPHGVDWNMLGEELSLADMQRIGNNSIVNAEQINEELGLKVPEVPFGHMNEIWERMLREYQEEDKFFTYGTIPDDSRASQSIESGYCMVRGNEILIVLTTMRS